ncbi:hypothetical protein [Aquisphaera insulae]|uniref:hypothetical protein n=1 Tax=Aquisphaera insulae TaxID=2712864 RepID=UPI0013EA7B6C|nr:hypothetical protein [Aquisphaera insulae]
MMCDDRSKKTSPFRKVLCGLFGGVLLGLFLSGPASAGLIISVPSGLSVTPGATVGFDVLVQYVGADSGPLDLAGYTVGLELAMSSGLQFTSLTSPTGSVPYVFDLPDSGAVGPTATDSIGSGVTSLIFYDLTSAASGRLPVRTLYPGDSYALGHVEVTVGTDAAPGIYALTLSPTVSQGGISDLNDPNGVTVLTSVESGSIVVRGSMVIPEPSSLLLGATGLSGLLLFALRRATGMHTA